jgi:hypothetical protein
VSETTEVVEAAEPNRQTTVDNINSCSASEPLNGTGESAESAAATDPDDGDGKSANAEAAKYRRRLRDTQAELESVAAQLDAVQRQQVELLIAESGVKPTAVWSVTGVAELLGDDGAIDTEKVTAAVETAREKFGIPKRQKGNYVPGVGNQPSSPPKTDTWTTAFSPPKRR